VLSGTAPNLTYTPTADYVGPDSFTFVANDGVVDSAAATVSITVLNVAVCGDGLVETPEECDDDLTADGDGCSATCTEEPGWDCTGQPSTCATICGDGLIVGTELCDDANGTETDGCTTQCQPGPVCTAASFAGGDRFATDITTGHCYVSFDSEQTTFNDAQSMCVAAGGHLATISGPLEQILVTSVQNTAENPWIGLTDALVEGSFGWITGEPLTFVAWEPGQPDGADPEDCVNLFSTADSPSGIPGRWNDTNCDFIGFTAGRICEITSICGDGIRQAPTEACDDGNATNLDGCSATCTVEPGAQCTGVAPTTCAKLVLNEVDYDQVGTDSTEFIEIYNAGTGPATLASYALVLMNGGNNLEYSGFGAVRVQLSQALDSSGAAPTALPAGAYLVIASPSVTLPPSALRIVGGTTNIVQNGSPDALGILLTGSGALVDALSYEGDVTAGVISGVAGTRDFTEGGSGLSVAQCGGEGSDASSTGSLRRVVNGRDTNVTTTDWVFSATLSPGVANP
jgi:cysteine-rich repeat protein